MTFTELTQAKKNNQLVSTPQGWGQVNGIGHQMTYIYFQDNPNSPAGTLTLFPNDEIDLYPVLVEYNGSNLHAFKDAPGWYVYAYSLLGQAGGTLDGKQITSYAHGYKIVAGPFDTEAQAKQVAI